VKRERVSDDVVVFFSRLYAQVSAGAVLTPAGAVVVDTLPFPQETREIIAYLQGEGKRGQVRYVVNTHRHGDHTHGNYLFPQAEVIAHRLCREALLKWGQESLDEARMETEGLAEVELRVPEVTFEQEMVLYLGGKTIELRHSPGHTDDGITVLVKNERILFAGDTVMPLPYIVWGDREELMRSMQALRAMPLENIIQGHGEVLLRGEIEEALTGGVNYLDNLYHQVLKKVEAKASAAELAKITIDKCGASPIALDGVARQLHQANVQHVYRLLKGSGRRS